MAHRFRIPPSSHSLDEIEKLVAARGASKIERRHERGMKSRPQMLYFTGTGEQAKKIAGDLQSLTPAVSVQEPRPGGYNLVFPS